MRMQTSKQVINRGMGASTSTPRHFIVLKHLIPRSKCRTLLMVLVVNKPPAKAGGKVGHR